MGMMEYTDPMSLNPPVSIAGTGEPGALSMGGDGGESVEILSTDPINMQSGDTVAGLDQSDNGIMGYDKYLKPQLSQEIIGIQSPRLIISDTAWTPTQVTADFTTYYDRAIVKLRNESGSTQTLHSFAIGGALVVRVAGKNGYLWEATNYDDVERNGELEYKLGNEFIVNTTQIESIGDWLQKELRPHDMYKLYLRGCHPYYEEGDLYTLDVSYTINGATSQTEEIDIDVQICGVSITREVGQLGQTVLSVRVPTGAWSKTTTTRARLLTAGLPFGALARGGIITVAASTYTGTDAQFICDGDHDEVEINAAIARLGEVGGGVVQLTRGTFNIAEVGTTDICISINSPGIVLTGEGMGNTILTCACTTNDEYILIKVLASNTTLYNFSMTASGTYKTRSFGVLMTESANDIMISSVDFNCANCIYGSLNTHSGLNVNNCKATILDGVSLSTFVRLYAATNVKLINNSVTFEALTIPSVAAFLTCGSTCSNVLASGNTAVYSGATSGVGMITGIYVAGVTGTIYTLSDNSFTFNGTYGCDAQVIVLGSSVSNSLVSGNTIIGADFNNAAFSYGIYLNGCDYCAITGNRVEGINNSGASYGIGIWVETGSVKNAVTGNILLNNVSSNLYDEGTNTAKTGNITS
jgi:hypothetical protein